ncbi:voltage-dependent anion-selective channel protein 2-like [Belonocnema kinseyi]|uniref:voltage-dependent anion-selective channel protein 2-like n=1 Tax=Belonocnema kinseyi TaxID=2817044 RepID=UPI00143D59AC|nr:voltage-dependent anion-selective channel protein 2-like [Belonocnema kinseyi]
MGCPSFSDLGKCAKDVFKNGFNYGGANCSITAKARKDFELGGNLNYNFDHSKMTGLASSRFNLAHLGKMIAKYSNDGSMSLQYFFDESLVKDVDLNTVFSFNSETTIKSLELNARYGKDELNTFCSLSNSFESSFSGVADFVYKYKDVFFGYQTGYDSSRNLFTHNNLGVSFNVKDIGYHFRCTSIPNEYGLSVHRKINNHLDVAINGIFAKRGSSQMWTLGIGAKYLLSEGSTFRFKIDKDMQIGFSLQQRLHDSLNLTLSFNIDCPNVQSGGHKAGLSLELEA